MNVDFYKTKFVEIEKYVHFDTCYFENLKGLIVGGMTDMHDNSIPFGKNVKEIILDITSEFNFPVVFDFPAGHLNDNSALIFGRKIELKVDENETEISIG